MPHQVINSLKPAVAAAATFDVSDKAPVANGTKRPPAKKTPEEVERERADRESLVMWRRPYDTLVFAGKEAGTRIMELKQYVPD